MHHVNRLVLCRCVDVLMAQCVDVLMAHARDKNSDGLVILGNWECGDTCLNTQKIMEIPVLKSYD